MIEITKTETYGWEAAIRGMRNPKNSWDKSDTAFWSYPSDGVQHKIGDNDLKLMKSLAGAGTDHGKFLRMITVTCDITAPFYWWKEFDTYKVGTVANSCSTMHKIHAKEFTIDDFSHDYLPLDDWEDDLSITRTDEIVSTPIGILELVIIALNNAREAYLLTKDKKYWWQMIQLLPTSYNQKRTVQMNYAVLKNMYHARKAHKLTEWHVFCEWVKLLPYSELITD